MDKKKPSGFINRHNKDFIGAGLMILLGLGTVIHGLTYKIGTLNKMGPGFFPVALGAILMLVGTCIALTASSNIPEGEEEHLPSEWRGWICISLSLLAFIVLGKYGGLVPATFAVVFISAMGDRQNTVKSALILSLIMVAICVAVFWWALNMQFSLFQWG